MISLKTSEEGPFIFAQRMRSRTVRRVWQSFCVTKTHTKDLQRQAGVLPSGMNIIEDFYLYVRQSMYVELMTPPVYDTKKNKNVASPPVDSSSLMNSMPENWIFSAYFVFCMLGPVVYQQGFPNYQTHLLMCSPNDMNGKWRNGKDTTTPTESGKDSCGSKNKHQKVEQIKREPGIKLRSSPPSMFTFNQELRIAAIAQSTMMNSDRKLTILNDRIIAMHSNKVTATKVLIESAKYFIDHARDDNHLKKEDCMEDLVHLRKQLATAAAALYSAQKEIVDCDTKKVRKEQDTPPPVKGFTPVHQRHRAIFVDLTYDVDDDKKPSPVVDVVKQEQGEDGKLDSGATNGQCICRTIRIMPME
jgi:hypothetical protein